MKNNVEHCVEHRIERHVEHYVEHHVELIYQYNIMRIPNYE